MKDLEFQGVRQKDYQVLTAAEESELLAAAAKGDKKAVEKLVKSNQGFIMDCAKKFCWAVPFADLVQIGNEALILSFKTFDIKKFRNMHCSRFITYAARRIKQSMHSVAINESFPFSASESTAKKILKVKREIEKLDGLKDSDFLALEQKTGIKQKLIKKYSRSLFSVSRIQNEDFEQDTPKCIEANIIAEGVNLDDFIPAKIDIEKVLKNFDVLSDIEKKVLRRIYGFEGKPETLQQIAIDFDCSREWVRQIHKKAIAKLKKILEGESDVFPRQKQIQQ